jgi:hypothetical protein
MNLPESAKAQALAAAKPAVPYLAGGKDVNPAQVLPPRPAEPPPEQRSVSALPDEQKRQAVQAMGQVKSHASEIKEVTPQEVPPRYRPAPDVTKDISSMPEAAKKEVTSTMQPVAARMEGQGRMVDIRDIAAPRVAWHPGLAQRTADRINALQQQGYNQDRIQERMTQRGFCAA